MTPTARDLVPFVAAVALLTATPGVDTVLVLRTTLASGARAGALASLGIALGLFVWGTSVSLGLGALVTTSAAAYGILRVAGALYLCWLGVRLLLGREQPRAAAIDLDLAVAREAPAGGERRALGRGLSTNLLNPKVGVFYVTFLPQFVPAGTSPQRFTFVLVCIHVLLCAVWFAALVGAAAPLGRALSRPRVAKALDRATGCVFIAFGVKLAFVP